MCKIGERVGAIISSDSQNVLMAGYGVYVGDVPCPFLGGSTNPKIKLDNGKEVWGCQCWWGPEAEIQQKVAGKNIIDDSGDLEPYTDYVPPTEDDYARCIQAIGLEFCGVEVTDQQAKAMAILADERRQRLLITLNEIIIEHRKLASQPTPV